MRGRFFFFFLVSSLSSSLPLPLPLPLSLSLSFVPFGASAWRRESTPSAPREPRGWGPRRRRRRRRLPLGGLGCFLLRRRLRPKSPPEAPLPPLPPPSAASPSKTAGAWAGMAPSWPRPSLQPPRRSRLLPCGSRRPVFFFRVEKRERRLTKKKKKEARPFGRRRRCRASLKKKAGERDEKKNSRLFIFLRTWNAPSAAPQSGGVLCAELGVETCA